MTSAPLQVVFKPTEDMTVQELCILLTPISHGMKPWQQWTLSPEWWNAMPEHMRRHFDVTVMGRKP